MKKYILFFLFLFSLTFINLVSAVQIGNVGQQGVNFKTTTQINYTLVNTNYSISCGNADTLDSIHANGFCYANGTNSSGVNCQTVSSGNPFDQSLNTTDSVKFNKVITQTIDINHSTAGGSPVELVLNTSSQKFVRIMPWTNKFTDDFNPFIAYASGAGRIAIISPVNYYTNQTAPYLFAFSDGVHWQILNAFSLANFQTMSDGFVYPQGYNLGIGFTSASDKPTQYFQVGRPMTGLPFTVNASAGTSIINQSSGSAYSFSNWFRVGDVINTYSESYGTGDEDGAGPYTVTQVGSYGMTISGTWVYNSLNDVILPANKVTALSIKANGRINLGGSTANSFLSLAKGNSTSGDSPIRFTSSDLLSTPTTGSIEYNGNYYATNGSSVRLAFIFNETKENIVTSGNVTAVVYHRMIDWINVPISLTLTGTTACTNLNNLVAGYSYTCQTCVDALVGTQIACGTIASVMENCGYKVN